MTEDDIPLDITGHEDREPPSEDAALFGAGDTESGEHSPEEDTAPPTADSLANDAGIQNGEVMESGEEDEIEPVEVLVQLADDGEIDPWDIDIVEVTDKFLERIDEADLRTSGRALFYASVLLRKKGDAMLRTEEPEPEPEPWEGMMDGEAPTQPGGDPFATLEAEMDRRLERKRARGMPQTLDELVRDLREAERNTWWKKSREYDTSGHSAPQRGTQELDYHSTDEFRMDDEPTAAEVTERTHGEDIEAVIDEVSAALREQYDQGRKEVLFREIEMVGGSRVETFLGLLFLAHRGEVQLRQDELFGDLWIQDPTRAAGSGEAVAD